MASVIALPRQGHLSEASHMLLFLKSKYNAVMVFDLTVTEIDQNRLPTENQSATPYGPCKEDAPSNAPEHRGIVLAIRDFVDSDHAGDLVSRLSRTSFIVFLESTPIFVYSKKQGSFETSSFGSEFVAMKS